MKKPSYSLQHRLLLLGGWHIAIVGSCQFFGLPNLCSIFVELRISNGWLPKAPWRRSNESSWRFPQNPGSRYVVPIVTLGNHHRLAINHIVIVGFQQPKTGLLQLRFPDAPFPDILHSYFSVCGLCLCGLLPPLDAMLGMSQASRQAAEDRGVLPPWKVKEQDAGKWEEMIRNCSKWSTNLLKELRPLDSNYPMLCDVWHLGN